MRWDAGSGHAQGCGYWPAGAEEGDIAAIAVLDGLLSKCDVVVAGPAVGFYDKAGDVADQLLAVHDPTRAIVLDA